ncbi:LPS assembly lipoprotein LptE [Rhizobium leucaenae]|uniref:LPS-assembly lipoprotein n=1 Tax=Rhizobium leucaenae TaxID=29450 RepID=A0A7W7ELV1_9HYPH|nr:LPS assembly lipoprotein LptE [Rhizobium leucaenae]MBB4570391.1 LPS-assembly lipoprotein [Rhizobium leucaenae]MBB6301033.1 LPS-assembly lipoprotein [Rhizobium leucaenae]
MSSDNFFKLARAAGVASLVAVAGLLASCQVRPLYAESTGVTQKLADVAFSDAGTRVGQQVRNQLIFIAGRGAGETKTPKYTVDLSVSSGTGGVLYLPSSDTSAAGRTTVTASFTLKDASDGKVLKSGSRSVTSLVDFPTQEFAKARAIRDSEDRAAREVAELVGADIAAALSR